jgi:predicted DNA-binding mobile mystery protein A
MKLQKKVMHLQRKQIDEQLSPWKQVKASQRPRRGWLRATRESLGMTVRQLADFLGTDGSGVTRLEEREVKGTATLQSLERAAKAMGCRLIYAIVPEESLEKTLDKKAHEAASRTFDSVVHTMRLERQGISKNETEKQIENLSEELKARLDPLIWKK